MILSVHAMFGAAAASLVPSHPVAGFALGFASHFVLDAIPHKDYDLISVESAPGKIQIVEAVYKKFRLIRDMTLVSLDAVLGLCLAFLFFFNPAHPAIFFIGAVSSLLPDFITFLYVILKHKPLALFFHFHASIIHSKLVLKLTQVQGLVLQFFTMAVLIGILQGAKFLYFYYLN
jgi:hypothetical protein